MVGYLDFDAMEQRRLRKHVAAGAHLHYFEWKMRWRRCAGRHVKLCHCATS
ncbi:MAG: hypothetical protein HYY37_00610 [Candidatus Aenigmarchaeota archaeon]|nr:hypothetical protein [Candidatus Aenigmarchaeota archaeon]